MQTSRSQILRNIRLALAKPNLPSFKEHGAFPAIQDRHIEPPVSSASEGQLVEKFRIEFEAVGGEFTLSSGHEAVPNRLRELIQEAGVQSVAVSDHDLCHRLQVANTLKGISGNLMVIDERIDSESSFARQRLKRALAGIQLSITGVEYLIAESGTLIVIAGACASRQISLLPTIHVVLATPNQICLTLTDAFRKIRNVSHTLPLGSALTLITGPSRTADIEKVLIKGVHGPTRIVVIMVGA